MSLLPATIMRKKLDGKTATAEDFARKISRLLLGDSTHGIEPLSQVEIMKKLGYKDKKSIRELKELAVELGLIELDSNGKAKLPKKTGINNFTYYNKNHPLSSDERIQYWQQDLLTRKDGAPLQSWKALMTRFESICNTLKTNPEQWVTGKNTVEMLDQGRTYMKQFMEFYKLKQAQINYDKKWTVEKANLQAVRYCYSKAARDFMGAFHIKYPDGEKGIMAQSIAIFHGNFADVRLSDEEIAKADKWLKDNYGVDSDIFRIFWFGIETMARNKAIYGAKSNYTIHTSSKTGKKIYIMEVYESKTKHIKQGRVTKFIKNVDLQKSIDAVRNRGGEFVVEKRYNPAIFTIKFGEILRELYKFLGKEKIHLANPEFDDTGYFMNHAFHALRHIGAHFHLRKTKYRYEYVAEIGGWKKIDELKDSYGEIPAEIKIEMMEDEEY